MHIDGLLERLSDEADFSGMDPGDGGAILVTRYNQQFPLTSAGAETRTLAAPQKAGMKCTLSCVAYVGDIVLTVEGGVNQTGNTVVTFGAAEDCVILESRHDTSNSTYRWEAVNGTTGGAAFT